MRRTENTVGPQTRELFRVLQVGSRQERNVVEETASTENLSIAKEKRRLKVVVG